MPKRILAALLCTTTLANAEPVPDTQRTLAVAAIAMTAELCNIAIPPEIGRRMTSVITAFGETATPPSKAEHQATIRAMARQFVQQRAALCSQLNASGLERIAANALD